MLCCADLDALLMFFAGSPNYAAGGAACMLFRADRGAPLRRFRAPSGGPTTPPVVRLVCSSAPIWRTPPTFLCPIRSPNYAANCASYLLFCADLAHLAHLISVLVYQCIFTVHRPGALIWLLACFTSGLPNHIGGITSRIHILPCQIGIGQPGKRNVCFIPERSIASHVLDSIASVLASPE